MFLQLSQKESTVLKDRNLDFLYGTRKQYLSCGIEHNRKNYFVFLLLYKKYFD